MRGAMLVLVRGTVKSLKWRLVFTKDQYSARCSSSLCLKPYHESSALGSPGRTSMLMTLLSSLNRLRKVSEALDLERSNGEERTESKCRKDKDHDLRYRTGPPAEFRRVSMHRLSYWSGQQQHLLQWLQALGAQEMQWAQALEKGPWLQMYMVPGNCTLWTFNHNTCENCLEEVQGSATSPLFTPPLFQNMWPCVQLLCAERNAPCQRDLAINKAEPPASAEKWQGNDQTDLQCQATRHCHHQVQWATCAAWHWGSGPHSEGEKTPMVWTMLQWCSQDSLWHTGWWKAWAWEAQNDMEAADRGIVQSGSSRLPTLMIDILGDLVWHLEGGPLMWLLPLYPHVNQKSYYDMIYMIWREVWLQNKWGSQWPVFYPLVNYILLFYLYTHMTLSSPGACQFQQNSCFILLAKCNSGDFCCPASALKNM